MGKKKFIIPMVAFGVMMPAMFMISACGKSGTPDDDTPKTPAHVHTYSEDWSNDETNHWHVCTGEGCDETTGLAVHVYDDNEDSTCNVCDYTRTQTTLAFKTGTCTFTYDGNTHAFDKNSLVTVTGATLDEVVVKYSTSKDSPVWTEEVPKNAGTYYVQLSVPETKEHTACTIDNLGNEDSDKVLTISPKSISLDNLVLLCKASGMNTNSSTLDLTLTSSDIDGLCGSDTLTVTLHKSAGDYSEGTGYDIVGKKSSVNYSVEVGIESTTGNYIFNASTTGKLYITKEMTKSGEESSYTYTAETAISKGVIVYYSVAVETSSGAKVSEAKNFDVTLSDSDAKIVDSFSKSSLFSVNLAVDGTLVAYGSVPESNTFQFYIAVQYNGSAASKNVTLTLTENTATTDVTVDEFTSAINLEDVNQYHATLKKGDTVIGENKADKTSGKYYSNNNGTEIYYEKYNTSFLKYSKKDAKWVRELVSENESSVFNATKFSSTLLRSLTRNDLSFSDEEQMYKLNSKVNNGTTYTDIALKFEDKKLVYVEYKINNETYTFEFEYVAPEITMPNDYTGTSLDNPISVVFVNKGLGTDAKKFISTGTVVTTANSTIYYSFEITDAVITAIGSTDTNTCSLSGEFTADGTGVTISNPKVYKSDGKTEVTNHANGNGKLSLTSLGKGTYIIAVTCDKACKLSLSLGEYSISKV